MPYNLVFSIARSLTSAAGVLLSVLTNTSVLCSVRMSLWWAMGWTMTSSIAAFPMSECCGPSATWRRRGRSSSELQMCRCSEGAAETQMHAEAMTLLPEDLL